MIAENNHPLLEKVADKNNIEIITENSAEANLIVKLEQKPILFDVVEAKSREVKAKLESLDLENLDVTEANLTIIKKTRAEINNELKVFEEQRKMVKDMIMKPYLEFETIYNDKIKKLFKESSELLKQKIDVVEDELLRQKIEKIESYFIHNNKFNFIIFEDFLKEVKILKSKSNKSYFSAIDEFLKQVDTDLKTIETLQNKDRVLAKYQIYKDLNKAISEVNIEVDREKQIKEEKERAEIKKQQFEVEQAEKRRLEAMQTMQEPVQETQVEEIKLYKAKFEVTATIEQIKALKVFMQQNNIDFKSIK